MSALADAATDYVTLRRSLGHKLDAAGRLLPRYVAYLDGLGDDTVTVATAFAWATDVNVAPTSNEPAQRMAIVRGFARHMSGIDARTEIPPLGLVAHHNSRRVPHLFTDSEISAVMNHAAASADSPLRAVMLETVMGLLAVTGMRVGEAIRLECGDIDWADGIITIWESKFGKSRHVPVTGTTLDALARYATIRDRHDASTATLRLFISNRGTAVDRGHFGQTFRAAIRSAGITSTAVGGPRVHDLRHSFAVKTLVGWYRQGDDVEALLPRLSTYLGHREPRYTYRYLTASLELLDQAARRLHRLEVTR
jgi:integrase